jgi:hypothetical protein
MATFVGLSEDTPSGDPVFVNMERVVSIVRPHQDAYTTLFVQSTQAEIHVKETPNQILDLMRLAQKA